jgi:hypothetical protein
LNNFSFFLAKFLVQNLISIMFGITEMDSY